jgi:hypothetical protein
MKKPRDIVCCWNGMVMAQDPLEARTVRHAVQKKAMATIFRERQNKINSPGTDLETNSFFARSGHSRTEVHSTAVPADG